MSLLDLSQLNLKVPLIYPYFPQIAHYFGAGFIPTRSESDHIIFLFSSEFMVLKVILFDFDFTLILSANNTSYNTIGESEGKQSESVKVGIMNLYLPHGCMLVRIQSVLLGHPVSFHDGVGKDVTLGGIPTMYPLVRVFFVTFSNFQMKISSCCTQEVVSSF